MQLKSEYPVAVICEVLDYPRSQIYESEIKAVIATIAGKFRPMAIGGSRLNCSALRALEKGLKKGVPESHHSDHCSSNPATLA